MSLVRTGVEGPVAVLELARPERHNSLVPELLEDLISGYAAVLRLGASVAVLAAAGRSFSTGGDLAAIRAAPDRIAYADRLVGLLNEAILTLLGGPLPLVAAVHGPVTGGSLGLVLACDHVVMAADVTVRPWYATIGFAPDGGWTALLPDLIGRHRAAGVLARDATIDAGQALAWGLADELAPSGEVSDRAAEVARQIVSGVAGARQVARRLTRPDLMDVSERLDAERAAFLELVDTPEATAGIDRFLERRAR